MTPTHASKLSLLILFLALGSGLSLVADEAVAAWPSRSERVSARMAERVYARQAIAEARAVRAEARAAEMARLVPEPPPPRPITLRRMARAGVPLPVPGQPQAAIAGKTSPPVARPMPPRIQMPPMIQESAPAVVIGQPAAVPTPKATASTPRVAEPGDRVWTLDPDPAGSAAMDSGGTRSVLATGGEAPAKPVAPPTDGERSGPAVTQPPIELLPTPPAK
jgi:hypothetical protein